jgi:glycosyltransferase involved in cell wall biosynthesis
MNRHLVTVIIPAYNQAAYIGEAIQSVLDQTYHEWELLIVDDGSTDETAAVITAFTDPRIRYIHQVNKGLPGARNRGIVQANGDYIAFLDADDAYHPDKLTVQVAHLDQNPIIGLSYSARTHIDQDGVPFWIYRAPEQVDMHDLVVDFPFTINDLLVRRSLVEQINGFDESYRLHGEDRDFYLRLALAGCNFAGTQRSLAYRRFHAKRVLKRIPERLQIMLRALETAFTDPRCPQSVVALRDYAFSKLYLYWAFHEFAQSETAAAREDLAEAIRLDPSYLENDAQALLRTFIWNSISGNDAPEAVLRRVLEQLPGEFHKLKLRADWAVAQAYLIKGTREIIWNQTEQGREDISRAAELGCVIDPAWIRLCANQVVAYEAEFGADAADRALQNLSKELSRISEFYRFRQLLGKQAVNRAFSLYRAGSYATARSNALKALYYTPQFITNRGVLSLLSRSFLMQDAKQEKAS